MAEETGSSFHPIPALEKNWLEKESKWKRHKSNTEKSLGAVLNFPIFQSKTLALLCGYSESHSM